MSNNNPFDLDDNASYESWRAEKLKDYPEKAEELVVEINDPHNLTAAEKQAIVDRCKKTK